MEKGLISSSVLLSTVGICQLGITPNFERKLLKWSEKSETVFSTSETPTKQGFSTLPKQVEVTAKQEAVNITGDIDDFVSEDVYTPAKLPKTAILGILQGMHTETRLGKVKILKILWGVSPGDSEKYRKAVSEYENLTGERE
jgi:predicted Zn-dependent protease with MMP-like domain